MFPTTVGQASACLRQDAVRMYGERRVRRALDSGEWASPWPGVVVDPARAVEAPTVIAAGLLASGPGAVVAGPTAAFLHGASAASPTPVHVVVPYGSSRRTRPGLVVHNGRSLDVDRTVLRGVPVLCLERTLTDVLCTVRPQDALAVADQVLAMIVELARPAFRELVRDRLHQRPDSRGTRIGERLLDLATGLAESSAESWLLWRLVDMGFPVPEVNHWVCTIDGEPRWRVDLGWPGLRIAVEYDGYAARVRELERRGWIVVRVEANDLSGMYRVETELAAAFRRRGLPLSDRVAGGLRPARHRERHAG